ncbi:helix-turn-helix DNA binding domain protein [Arthrobacter phage Zucker]|nr:helix-turn-helix DNA binding domain protein [Arthrobacter phage Zucker]
MGINAAAINAATNRNIMLGILDKGTSKNATAIKAGIAPNTFYRKLNSCGDFTLRELGQIADALDLNLQDMLKDVA